MTLQEAIQWVDPHRRDPIIKELEYANGIETADIVIQKFNEACRIVLENLTFYDTIFHSLKDAECDNDNDDIRSIIETIIQSSTKYAIDNKQHLKDVISQIGDELLSISNKMIQ